MHNLTKGYDQGHTFVYGAGYKVYNLFSNIPGKPICKYTVVHRDWTVVLKWTELKSLRTQCLLWSSRNQGTLGDIRVSKFFQTSEKISVV